jgi:hypothetical protein
MVVSATKIDDYTLITDSDEDTTPYLFVEGVR